MAKAKSTQAAETPVLAQNPATTQTIVSRPIVHNHRQVAPIDVAAVYDLDDSSFDPALDDPEFKPAPKAEEPKPAPERGTDGRFLKTTDSEPVLEKKPTLDELPRHPEYLREMAEDLGLSEAEIETMPTVELGLTVKRLQKVIRADGRDRKERMPESANEAMFGKDAEPRVDPDNELGLPMPEAAYDPGLVKVMKDQNKKIDRLQKLADALLTAEHNRLANAAFDKFDVAFASMRDFQEVFGSGPRAALSPESPELERRQAVLDAITRKIGQNQPPDKYIPHMKGAAAKLFGSMLRRETQQEPQPDPLQVREREWRDGTLARPDHGERPMPKGTNRAVRAVSEKMRGMDLDEFGDEGSEADGLLD